MLYEDLTLPDGVRDALVDDINRLPLEPFKDILEHIHERRAACR